jgi:formylglycine-generating enzyme required for sulfatase activity
MVQDNVPVAEGVKILDFGLAKIKSGELLGSFVQAQTSGLMGSPFYMAPEQWSDEEPDARADIYSLGVILYQMLAGEVPFKGSSIPSIMKKHLTLPPPSFQSMGASVPPAVEAVVRHALEKEVEARIDSIPTFLRDLHAALNSSPVVASALRTTVGMDPNKTIASVTEQPPTQPPKKPAPDGSATAAHPPIAQETNFGASFESMAGTVSGAQLDKLLEEESQRKQREERERREKEQQDKLERMALQAKELEDRLERLSGSMPPSLDPETTRVQGSSTNPEWAASTGAGASAVSPRRSMVVDITPKRKGPSAVLLIGGALMILILGGVGIGTYLMFGRRAVVDDPRPTPSPIASPAKKVEMVAIDGGTFQMGRNTGPVQETPAHAVTVQPFLMDTTEVTNTEYADFVREMNHPAPSHWAGNKLPFGQEQWPVVNVSIDDAIAFAQWRSKRDGVTYRLPTEEEWEYAARNGEQDDLYPWGREWQNNAAILKEATPFPVGSRPGGKNKWGVFDLIGNVWEMTSSNVSVYPGNTRVIPKSYQDWITIRGGGYVSDPASAEAPVSSCLRDFVPRSTKRTLLGFRLVRSP